MVYYIGVLKLLFRDVILTVDHRRIGVFWRLTLVLLPYLCPTKVLWPLPQRHLEIEKFGRFSHYFWLNLDF